MTYSELGLFFVKTKIPFLLVSSDGRLLEANKAARTVLDSILNNKTINREKILDDNSFFQKIIPAAEKKFIAESVKEKIISFSVDIPINIEPSVPLWFSIQITRITDDTYFCVIHDISKQKSKEYELLSAKETAEHLSIMRNQFFANVSHEIRTPIQTIIGTMELLNETMLDKEQREYTRQVCFSADVLLSLVNDILDFSKIESGQFTIETIEFNLIRQIEQTVDIISMEAHLRNLEIIVDIHPQVPTFVIGDPNRLQQILLNLVKNAVKFTSSGHVLVYVYPHDAETLNNIIFEVADTGIGIDEKNEEKLFSNFYQADVSTTRKYGGTGLGLAISKNLVHLMNGQIGMRANKPAGSIFWFEIPFYPSPKNNTIDKFAHGDIIPANARFLLVDDNLIALRCLEGKLATFGCTQITLASSGKEALIQMREASALNEPYDVVFIDMIMSEMDGWRLAAEINADHLINNAQLYLMVPEGKIGGEAKMKLLEWFNAYIYKPIKQEMLYDLLREHYKFSIDLEVIEELEGVKTVKKSSADEQKNLQESSIADSHIAAGKCILIAEDHPVNQKLLRIFLEKFGATVFTVNNGQEAVLMVHDKPDIDLIFMDIQMPVMNGVEAAIELRYDNFKNIIIACTANTETDEFEDYFAAGMDAVLTKPFKKQGIKEILLKWLVVQKNNDNPIQKLVEEERQSMMIFDFKTFLETVGFDYPLTFQIIDDFIVQTEKLIAQGEKALQAHDVTVLGQVGHSIKGSAASICAVPLSIESKKLEFAGKAGNMDEAKQCFEQLKPLFAQFCETSAAWKKDNADKI